MKDDERAHQKTRGRYVAFTKASAFSPTDAMPLSVRIKSLMLIESIASFLTVGLVAARAVNILNM
jgi:hypothetical protein